MRRRSGRPFSVPSLLFEIQSETANVTGRAEGCTSMKILLDVILKSMTLVLAITLTGCGGNNEGTASPTTLPTAPEYAGGLTYYAVVSNYTDKYLQVNPYSSSCMNTHGGDDGHNLAPGQSMSLQLVTSDSCAEDYPFGVSSQYFKFYLLETATAPYDSSSPFLIAYLVMMNISFNPHAVVYFVPTWDFSSGYNSNLTMAPDPIGQTGFYDEHANISFCKGEDVRCDNSSYPVFVGSETGFDYCSPTGGSC